LHELAYVASADTGNRSGRTARPMCVDLLFVHLGAPGACARSIIRQDTFYKIRNGAAGGGLVNAIACAQMVPSLAACGLKIRAFEFVPRWAACYLRVISGS